MLELNNQIEEKGKFGFWPLFFLLSFSVLLVLSYQLFPLFFVLVVLAGILFVFTLRPDWSLYLLVLTAFFHSWQIDFSVFGWAREVPYLSAINAPVVDFVVIIAGLAFVLSWFFGTRQDAWHKFKLLVPAGLWYLGFLVTAFVSVFFAFDYNFSSSLKYFIRPELFVIIFFVLVPFLLVSQRETLEKVLKIMFGVGLFSGLFALGSVFVNSGEWFRLVPYSLFGWTPFGYNQNLLAEALVVLAPTGFYWFYRLERKIYLYAGMFMVLAGLLTFSRAAWLGFSLEFILLVYFYRQEVLFFVKKNTIFFGSLGILIGLVAVYLLGFLLFSSTAKSSTSSRWDTIQVVGFYLQERPWLGYGPGMYMPLLNNTAFYTMEYGEALDAHGFIWKILVEEGILGLLAFVGFLLVFWWQLFLFSKNKKNATTIVFLISVSGIILFQFFNTSYFNSVMWLPIGLGLASLKFSYE